MKQLLLTATLLSVFTSLIAQQPVQMCGADELSYQLYTDNPALRSQMENNRAYLKAFTQQYVANQANRNADSIYTVPVVFHVIHMYGAENVTDAQVMSGLQVLNRNFSNQHPDSANIVAAFKPIAANCEIEFKIAHLDPAGNCTNGITRHVSTYTKIGDHSVKDLVHWDPAKYLNVYVVRSIANLAGHCLMPDQAAAKPEWDGIVIDDSYLGNIGTSSELTSVVMAHETGHYLNLFHIWGGNNVPGYFYQPVGQQGNCAIGDDVQDTPETIGWSSCNLSSSSCSNSVDNVQNAMDYSYCNFMFTQGQRQRMRAALNSTIANRNNLITANNLAATGVNMNTICKADFTASRFAVCVGDSVLFTDKSIATPDSWQWNFGDNTSATEQNPAHVYSLPGDYIVTLTASKNGNGVTSNPFTIRVNDVNPLPYFVQGFETAGSIEATSLLNTTDNDRLKFAVSGNTGYNSSKSAVIIMADTSGLYNGRATLTSPALNMATAGSTQFSFRYACSQKKLNSDDALDVYVSADCGKTWTSKGRRFGANLRTIGSVQTDTAWVPADSLQWKTYSFNLAAAQNVSTFMFRIDFTGYYTNNFYIDNINLNEGAYSGTEKLLLENIQVVPNPADDYFSITGDFDRLNLTLLDINGRELIKNVAVANSQSIDISTLPKGAYFIRLENETSFCTRRLVK